MAARSGNKRNQSDLETALARSEWERAAAAMKLPFPVGVDGQGRLEIADLAELGNLLVSGAPGQGKTVFLRTMICALSSCRTPEQVRFVIGDPRDVEYRDCARGGFGYVSRSVVVNPEDALSVLADSVSEMLARRKLRDADRGRFEAAPHLVFVFDEVESWLCSPLKAPMWKLLNILLPECAEMKIHFVLATQSSVANIFPKEAVAFFRGRLVFRTAFIRDSRLLLEVDDAANPCGGGELLFKAGARAPVRVQGLWAPEGCLASAVGGADEDRELEADYRAAVELARQGRPVSLSRLQRHLGIGLNRAREILRLMHRRIQDADKERE